MLIKRIEQIVNLDSLQEDFRKLGVNLITAGAGVLFFSKTTGLQGSWFNIPALCVIIFGVISIVGGVYRGSSNESK
jgi:hypothetical protein